MNNSAEESIRFIISEYCHRSDSGDAQGWADLFSPDGSFIFADKVYTGRDGLLDYFEMVSKYVVPGMHVAANMSILVNGSSAVAKSNFIFVTFSDQGGAIRTGGLYADQFVLIGDSWLLKERQAKILFSAK